MKASAKSQLAKLFPLQASSSVFVAPIIPEKDALASVQELHVSVVAPLTASPLQKSPFENPAELRVINKPVLDITVESHVPKTPPFGPVVAFVGLNGKSVNGAGVVERN
jgi:hypothetical protein